MEISVCKTFKFDAAHFLPHHDGKCKNLHGHSYTLEVEITGNQEGSVLLVKMREGSKAGMIVDFGDLKTVVEREVVKVLDHTCLNDLMPDFYPTAENLLLWIELRLLTVFEEALGDDVKLKRLRLYETSDSFAELTL